MKSLRRFFARLANLVTRRAQDERLKEEIEGHIALQTEENLRAGLSPLEARRQAMLKFGGVEAMKQEYRAKRGCHWSKICCRMRASRSGACAARRDLPRSW